MVTGSVLYSGTPADVRNHPDVLAAYIGSHADHLGDAPSVQRDSLSVQRDGLSAQAGRPSAEAGRPSAEALPEPAPAQQTAE
jgi:hypothetical protein